MNNTKNEVYGCTIRDSYDKAHAQIDNECYFYVYNEIEPQLWNLIGDQIHMLIYDQITNSDKLPI